LITQVAGENIPIVMIGTSPFIGAGQFSGQAYEWRNKFLDFPEAMLEIMEASYEVGGRGFQAIPMGKICEAAKLMSEKYDDFIITGSTYPGKDPRMEDLIEIECKIIFVHGMISDTKGKELLRLLDDISSRGIIPGMALHEPISVINYCIKNVVDVKAFLIPFNANGLYMDDQKDLEILVDNTNQYSFIGMKTLAAGALSPELAFEYISKHNISAVAIGMVDLQEAKEATEVALKYLTK
jgi:hypothetical protein